MRALVLVLVLVPALVLVGAPASAQDAPSAASLADARTLFDQGMALVAEERWGEALELFRRSLEIVERPATIFNIGTALLRLGRPNEAIETFERFLASAGSDAATASLRTEAAELLEEARAARVRVTLTLTPADAAVRVDAVLVEGSGSPRELFIDPGRHVIDVLRDGYEPGSIEVSTLAGESLSRSITLTEIEVFTTLTVVPSVADAVVEVDGAVVGADVAMDVAPGDHTVRVSADGHQPFDRSLTIERGQTLRLEAQLEPIGSATSLAEDPIFWTVTGILLAGAIAGAVGIGYVATQAPDPYRGTTNVVLRALSF